MIRDWPTLLLHLGIVPPALYAQFEDTLARAISLAQGEWGLKQARRRTARIWQNLSTAYLRAGFHMWARRTAALRTWWRSPDAAAERVRSMGREEVVRRTREEKRLARAREADTAARARAARRSPRRAAQAARATIAAMAMLLRDADALPDRVKPPRKDPAVIRYPFL